MKTKIFVICYLFLIGCSSDNEVPNDIINQDKMVAVMLDMYLAEGKVNNMRLSRDSSLAIFDVYEDMLYKKHGVIDSVYERSMSYYYDHPDMLETIYESVLDSLNLKQERLKEKEEDPEDDKDESKKENEKGETLEVKKDGAKVEGDKKENKKE